MSNWKTFFYGMALVAFAGIMSATVAQLENGLFAPFCNYISLISPEYFNWNSIEYIKEYPSNIILLTCAGYALFNVIIGPIVEELFLGDI